MKNNLGPYLSWLLTERPFAAPSRGDDPTDIALLPPIQSTTLAGPVLAVVSSSVPSNSSSGRKRATFVEPVATQQTRVQAPSSQANQFVADQSGSYKVNRVQYHKDEEEMARLRIEPTPKRPKLSSAVQTPRATNPDVVASGAPAEAAKSTYKSNVSNPYGTYPHSQLAIKARRSDYNVQLPQLITAVHLHQQSLLSGHRQLFLIM